MRSLLLPITIVACVAAASAWLVLSPPASRTPPQSQASQPAVQLPASGAAAVLAAVLPASSVDWTTLTAEQRSALRPLAKLWPKLSPEHQRSWIALAHNFNHMSEDEQSTLQGRMGEWARLTPAQRTQARLNFGETRRLSADKKREKWEEYQALPAKERERLAKDRPVPPVSAAPALRPTPADRIVRRRPASGSKAKGAQPTPATLENPEALPPLAPASLPASEPSW